MIKNILIILIYLMSKLSYADNNLISLYDLQSKKRNTASCNRLGNIYDACQWMMKFTIKNNSSKKLNSFCSVIKINKKKYEICSSKKFKENPLKPNQTRVILVNLTDLINYKNDYPKPLVRLVKVHGKF
tara:strand:- start:10 stop:396 length:387 start_codon:yes stop_codon:yes gene_type:complete